MLLRLFVIAVTCIVHQSELFGGEPHAAEEDTSGSEIQLKFVDSFLPTVEPTQFPTAQIVLLTVKSLEFTTTEIVFPTVKPTEFPTAEFSVEPPVITKQPNQRAADIEPEFDSAEEVEVMHIYAGGTAKKGKRSSVVREASTTSQLLYRGGGVAVAPQVFLVLFGSQWIGRDPSGEANLLTKFLAGVGGTAWINSVTQYCSGVSSGSSSCDTLSVRAGNPKKWLNGTWYDSVSAAPSSPRQSDLAAAAVRAAKHFGRTTSASNANALYVIATAKGFSSSGFGSSYCAWHSYTRSNYGAIAYMNLPYITDAGSRCGSNFKGLGSKAGITIVFGHELGEMSTDPFLTGWMDADGAENADKCSWISSGQGAVTNLALSTGTFAVQSLWSNAFSGGGGGCVLQYP